MIRIFGYLGLFVGVISIITCAYLGWWDYFFLESGYGDDVKHPMGTLITKETDFSSVCVCYTGYVLTLIMALFEVVSFRKAQI